jgi:predicted dehydrogenase
MGGAATHFEATREPARYNSHMSELIGRRTLLRGVSTTAASLTAASYSRVLGANDRIQLGAIGVGDRGRHDMQMFLNNGQVDVVAVCDVYAQQIDLAKQKAPNAKTFSDHRKLLETKEIDAVLIATPDHWHATCAIDALNAGKDVYVEKPLTRTIGEGPLIVKAARVNERICQVGMQQRSGKHYIEAKQKYVDSGKLGKVTLARTWWHGNGYHLRRAPASLQTKPSNLDWAHFLGPLKWRDYDPQQYFNWRAYLDFGGGQVTDLFTHWIDVVHMFLGQEVPTAAVASGGVYNYKDGRTAPDTICVLLEYPADYTATFEATLAPGITGAAIEICGTKGRLYIDRGRYEFREAVRGAQPVVVQAERGEGGGDLLTQDHVKNFLDCVRSRQRPNGDVLIGHRSAQASHLGNIAYLERRRIDFDPVREEILPF